MTKLDSFERRVAQVAKAVSLILLCCIVLVIALQVFTRQVVGEPIIWTEEAARYLLIWFTMIGSGWLGYTGGHIGLALGQTVGSSRVGRVREVVVRALGTAVLVVLAVGTAMAADQFTSSSAALRIPTSIVYLAFPIGCAVWAIHNLCGLLRVLQGREPVAEQATVDPEVAK